jgi:TP901 family phage tail tape measure protein
VAADGRIEIDTRINSDGITQGIDDIKKKLKEAGSNIKDVGDSLTKSISLPIAGVGVAAFKMSNDFNAAMANVATLIPDNIKRIGELKKSVQDMAMETGKSTSDIADGLYQVVSTFGDTADTSKILEMNVKAAAAGMATTTDAINLTAAVSKGYNDTSSTMIQHITDLAFQTANLGITTFPELSSSIGGVVPLAATLGIKMDDLFAVFATGAGVTGSTSEVSTQFKTVLQSLMAPTTKMGELMKDLGYSNGEAMLKSLGLQGTINKIVDTAKNANVPLQDYISSIDGQTLALALNGNLSKGFTDNLKAMGNVAGATNNAYKQQTEGVNKLGHEWDQAKQKGIVFMQQLGDAMAPVLLDLFAQLKPFVDKLGDLITSFSKLDPHTKKMIMLFAGLLAAVGPTLAIFGRFAGFILNLVELFSPLILAISEAGGIIPILGAALTAITGPIGLIILAVSALVAGFIYLWNTNKSFRESMQKLWIEIQANFTFALTYIEAIVIVTMRDVMAFIQDILSKIKVFWSEHGSQIMEIIKTALTFVWNTIVNVMGFIKGIFQADWPLIVGVVTTAWALIKSAIKIAIDLVMGIISVGLDLLTGHWDRVWNDIKETFKNIWGDIINTFRGVDLWEIGKNIIDGLVNGVKSMAGAVGREIKSIADSIPDGLKKFFGIQSPSKLMRDEIGKWIPAGLAEGINANLDVVTRSANKMGQSAIPVMPQNLLTNNLNNSSNTSSKSLNVNVYPQQASVNEQDILNTFRRAAVLYG